MTDGLKDIVFDSVVAVHEKRRVVRAWLRTWQQERLLDYRKIDFARSLHADILSIVIYFFMPCDADFASFEFSILQTWKVVGKLPTRIVVDRHYDSVEAFRIRHKDFVDVRMAPMLKVGDIKSMTEDCVEHLHERFETPYCLIIQDDGFPIDLKFSDSGKTLNVAIDEFLGKYDYVGGPSVRDIIAQHWVDLTRCVCMNGGLSLRSRRICQDVASQWRFWRKFIGRDSSLFSEDAIYSQVCCRNPAFRLRNRFAPSRVARRFSLPDFDGVVDIRNPKVVPFGVHGPTAIWQMVDGGWL